MNSEFAVFILTHGRPDKVKTIATLEKGGYTGKIYLIVDNLDETQDRYKELFGDQVVVFDKFEAAEYTDAGDTQNAMRGVVYARNASFKIARDLGIDYFLELDDDYSDFNFRYDDQLQYKYRPITNLDDVFEAYVKFLKNTPTKTITMAQGGDFIGGSQSTLARNLGLKRKAMNTFFCATDRPFRFYGRINEDVNAYVLNGSRGELYFMNPQVCVQQTETQQSSGGLTELYLDAGTYFKSFLTVIYHPSSVKVGILNSSHKRIHHRIDWTRTVPLILNEKYKKL